jgi:hypothetical protein
MQRRPLVGTEELRHGGGLVGSSRRVEGQRHDCTSTLPAITTWSLLEPTHRV